MNTDAKPVCKEGLPKGWHKRLRFIDDNDDVFCNGKFIGKKNETAVIGVPEEVKLVTKEDVASVDTQMILEQIKALQQENSYFRSRISMLDGKSDLTAADIARGIVAAQNETTGKPTYADHRDIDPEDILETPAIFSSYGVFFTISDRRLKNGQTEKVPYGLVCNFEYANSKRTNLGKEDQVSNVCQYKCYSKKIKAWLMGHPHFNIHFYLEDNMKPISLDARLMAIVAAEYAKLNAIDNVQHLKDMASHYKIPLGGSWKEIIPLIAAEKAKEEMMKELNQNKNRSLEAIEDIFKVK